MQIVVVSNKTGTQVQLQKCIIKPLRETTKDQNFTFGTCAEALRFESNVNAHPLEYLTALYAPKSEDLEAEGIEYSVIEDVINSSVDEGENQSLTLEEKLSALAKELEENNKKDALQLIAKEMKLENYEDLNKGPLAELIASHTDF